MIRNKEIVYGLTAFMAITGTPATAEITGALDMSFIASDRKSTDTDLEGDPFKGILVNGFITKSFDNGYRLTGDANWESISTTYISTTNSEENQSYYNTGPDHVGVIGLHLGRVFDPLYVGAYIASGYTNGLEEEINGSVSFGIEAEYKLSEKVNIFAQLGKVEDAIGYDGDNEYEGRSWRLGASAQLTEKLHASLDYEYSKSDNCFEDCEGDWGDIKVVDVDITYAITDDFYLIAGFEKQKIRANTEDRADVDNLSIGVRVPFGGSNGNNNLSTPSAGYKAAGWMAPLD
jgi:hypothetical protein